MGPGRTRQEIAALLGRAAGHAQHAEAYHLAAAEPLALKGQSAHQAARDATAMQVIELGGCADGFGRERGEARTTMARLEEALEPVIEMRVAHTHPDRVLVPPVITPAQFGSMMRQVREAIGNLDSDTARMQSPGEVKVLNSIYSGLVQIGKDGLPNPAALRPRDLHYAGYYHEIQVGRLAKATDLYNYWDAPDPRHAYVNRTIFHTDDLAHKFHLMRGGPDLSELPISVVAADFPKRVPDRLLSEVLRELRQQHQTVRDRVEELQLAAATREKEEYRDAVRGLARQYVSMTGNRQAAGWIHDYIQQQKPPLDREMMDSMRKALQAAVDPGGDYLAAPEAVRNQCLHLYFALERHGDGRLIDILDAAEVRRELKVRNPEGVTGEAAASAKQNKEPPKQAQFSRWTGEPLGSPALSNGQRQKP